jgi:glucokinase
MMSAEVVIGVDVGGTTTAAGLVDARGDVLAHAEEPTRGRPGATVAALLDLIDRLRGRAVTQGLRVAGVGLGIPGTVDAETGVVGADVHHVPDLAGARLTDAIRGRLDLPAFADNDVNVLALGEWMYGAGAGARSLAVLALGTGVGGGIILDGALHRGHGGFGGELGHVPVKFDGRPCICGGRGCLKAYVSGSDIAARGAEALGRTVDAAEVFRLAGAGHPAAGRIVDEVLAALGAGLAVIVNGLNPERVIVTGGVARSLAPFEARLRERLGEYAFARALERTLIQIVPRGKDATVRGGGALFHHETRRRAGRR